MTGRYLKVDLYRMIHAPQFYIGIGSVFLVYIVSTAQTYSGTNVADIFWLVKFFSMIICIFAGSSFAFANSLLEDEEHRFCYAAVLRGNNKAYVRAKVICCFLAAMLTIIIATLLYVCLLRMRLPFFETDNSDYDNMRKFEIFGSWIRDGGFFIYFLGSGLLLGLLGGMLSLVSMWLSLVAKNKMFAVCIPVVGYYFLVNYLSDLPGEDTIWLNFNALYMYSCYAFEGKPICSFFYTVFLAVGISCVLEKLIYRQVCRVWR